MKSNSIEVLVVSRNSNLSDRVAGLFNDQDVNVSQQSNLNTFLTHSQATAFQIVILTSSVCKNNEEKVLASLGRLKSHRPSTQILFLVEPEDVDIAMSALKLGTYQYAKIPVSDSELRLLIETALEMRPHSHAALPSDNEKHEDRFEQLIGRSEAMRKVYRQIRQAAVTDIPVLIVGETGTGKDLAAQAIHRHSQRKSGPYLPVNLGALPSDLVASELFGHERGSFTGAMKQHEGKFEQGNSGTVFLDEIDAIDEKVQVSLLRLLEQKKFHRLGGKRAIRSDTRLIAASNENLEELVRSGYFREDLFYRLDVFRILMPPLRERKGDLSLLTSEFLARFNLLFKKNVLRFDPETLGLLEAYHWPGNVREFKNLIQRAVLVCDGDAILPKHLPARFQSKKPQQPTIEFEIGTPLSKIEREMILQALSATDNNRKRAAELLGISRRAIYNKLRKHNID